MFTSTDAGYAWLAFMCDAKLPAAWDGALYVLAKDEGWDPTTSPDLERLAELANEVSQAIRTGVPYRERLRM